jgi:hypothetical protein
MDGFPGDIARTAIEKKHIVRSKSNGFGYDQMAFLFGKKGYFAGGTYDQQRAGAVFCLKVNETAKSINVYGTVWFKWRYQRHKGSLNEFFAHMNTPIPKLEGC